MRLKTRTNYKKEKLLRKKAILEAKDAAPKGNVYILRNADTGKKKKSYTRWWDKIYSYRWIICILGGVYMYHFYFTTIMSQLYVLVFITLIVLILYGFKYLFSKRIMDEYGDMLLIWSIILNFIFLHGTGYLIGLGCNTETYTVPVDGIDCFRTRYGGSGPENLTVKFNGSSCVIPYSYDPAKFKGDPKDYDATLKLKKVLPDFYLIESVKLKKRDGDDAED